MTTTYFLISELRGPGAVVRSPKGDLGPDDYVAVSCPAAVGQDGTVRVVAPPHDEWVTYSWDYGHADRFALAYLRHLEAPRPNLKRAQEEACGGAAERAAALHAALRATTTATEILADDYLWRLCDETARRGRRWSYELCEYAPRQEVEAAVAIVAAQQVVALAAETARREAFEQMRASQEERERPTREAVIAAYIACGYRVAAQGHDTMLRIAGTEAGVSSNMYLGDRYSSRCTWRKNTSRHTITIRSDWMATAHARGLDTVEVRGETRFVIEVVRYGYRLMTPMAIVRAVRQGRGTGLEVEEITVERGADGVWRKARKGATFDTLAEICARIGLAVDTPVEIVADALEERCDPVADLVREAVRS